jgi:hypothetical protein
MSILVAIGALAVAVTCCALLSPEVDSRASGGMQDCDVQQFAAWR